jgi:hypothetical protein
MRDILTWIFLIITGAFFLWLLFHLFYFALKPQKKDSQVRDMKKESPLTDSK